MILLNFIVHILKENKRSRNNFCLDPDKNK